MTNSSELRTRAIRVAGLACLVATTTLSSALAQTTSLSIKPITWNVVGLDSNNVTIGPSSFLVGVRVCNTGAVEATGVTADFSWLSSNPYINLQNGTSTLLVQDSYGVLDPAIPADVTKSKLAAGQCFDFYFNIELTRDSAAYATARRYRITAAASNATSVSTPTPREIYVERLVSQNRNKNVRITGPSSAHVGGIFTFTMEAETTTNGYEQLETYIVFPNTVFQVISSNSTFSVGSPVDSIYADSCAWNNDPTSPSYMSCTGSGKAGGVISQEYRVKIISLPAGSNTLTLNGVVYDYSGSSFHYNSNYSSQTLTFDVTPQPTAVRFGHASGMRSGSSIVLAWDTSHEVDNLGFHVWREENGEWVRVTPSLIAGSALFGGRGTPLPAGADYRWRDPSPEDGNPAYWIEAISLAGESELFGPVRPPFAADAQRVDPSSSLLADLSSGWPSIVSGSRRLGALSTSTRSTSSSSRRRPVRMERVDPFDIAASDAVKLTIRREGWIRVSSADLFAAGLEPGPSSELRLLVEAREVPIEIEDGGDGMFDSGDSISFYGLSLDTPSTHGRVYWLIRDIRRTGSRIERLPISGAPPISTGSFPFTIERRDRTLFFGALDNGNDENFFGPLVGSTPAILTLDVTHLDRDGDDAIVEVILQGVSDDRTSDADHRVRVDLNGARIGEVVFDGQQSRQDVFVVTPTLLRNGENSITFVAENGPEDVSLVDRIRLTYPHAWQSDDGLLRASAPGLTSVSISGFPTSDLVAVDITDPEHPVLLDVAAKTDESGFAATISTPAGIERVFLVSTRERTESPDEVRKNHPSSWNRVSSEADLLIIGHGSFLSEAEPLAAARRGEGLRVALIDVEDLYDEFAHGAKDPGAIRAFLRHAAKTWRHAPAHVLLFGDGSVDPKDYLGYGDLDFIPVHLVMTQFNKVPSDEWYVDFDDDGVGEMTIGRLPARDRSEAALMIEKTLSFASKGQWSSRIELVSDHDAEGLDDFVITSERLAGIFDGSFTVTKNYVSERGASGVRSALLEDWTSGRLFVNYYGHGSVRSWSRDDLFTTNDARNLRNAPRYPVVSSMTCLTGFFHDVTSESLAEALLRAPGGGAAAVWGSTALTHIGTQAAANEALVRAFFFNRMTLGEAARSAKRSTNDPDVRKSWILFGDPTLRLPK